MLDTCDTIGDDEYDKNSIIFNYCYIEKVIIKKKSLDQVLVSIKLNFKESMIEILIIVLKGNIFNKFT